MRLEQSPYGGRAEYEIQDLDTGKTVAIVREGPDAAMLALLFTAAPDLIQVARALVSNEYVDLGDLVYQVREREGLGWNGPSVKQWSDAVQALKAALRACCGVNGDGSVGGAVAERAAVVAWLRSDHASACCKDSYADAIERGEHRR